jgi:hypothetical protein
MKVCVTMVGVCRPTFDRVKQNIEANIHYFLTTYPQHTFAFVLLTYINSSHNDLSKYCSEKGIEAHFIPHLEESDFKFKVKNPNFYRAFYSISYILDKIPENTYDCIVRLRLDSEVKSFELYDTIDPTKYYTVNENKSCSDNIGYANYNVIKNIWALKNCTLNGINIEKLVYLSIKKNKYYIKHFKFHYILHQSSDPMFDGVKQWSKRSREWIFDGKDYINRDI